MRFLEKISEELFTSFCLVLSITLAFLSISILLAFFPISGFSYFTRFLFLFSTLLTVEYVWLFKDIYFLKRHSGRIRRYILGSVVN
jgi:hypothetical protein